LLIEGRKLTMTHGGGISMSFYEKDRTVLFFLPTSRNHHHLLLTPLVQILLLLDTGYSLLYSLAADHHDGFIMHI